ncbi:MAG: hypothetical protein WKH64_18405 [Chloroflexia bacterium]
MDQPRRFPVQLLAGLQVLIGVMVTVDALLFGYAPSETGAAAIAGIGIALAGLSGFVPNDRPRLRHVVFGAGIAIVIAAIAITGINSFTSPYKGPESWLGLQPSWRHFERMD